MITCLLWMALLPQPADVRNGDLEAAIHQYKLGNFQASIEILKKQKPEAILNGDVNLWIGKSYFRLRRWDDAIRQFERATLIDPVSGLYHLWLGRAFGRKAEHTAFFLALGPARRVLKEFETAVRLAPENTEARFDLLEYYLSAPSIVGGGRDHARDQVEAIAKLNPRLGRTARARLYEDEKRFDPARKELMASVADNPDRPEALDDLADFLIRRGEYVAAESYAKRALDLAQMQDHKALLMLMSCWVRSGRNLAQAERNLQSMSQGPLDDDDPPFADVYFWLGLARQGLGEKEGARQALATALRFNPELSRAKAVLAQLR